jgi:hypothetical protein
MNWSDAGDPPASKGAFLNVSYMQGFIWCENIGWINLGNGTPTGKCGGFPCYSMESGPESGVNVAAGGELWGYAWGENVGWINFSGGALAAPPKPARFDAVARRLRGCAWGENIGWINLDDADTFVGFLCPADYNRDGFVDGIDYDGFNNAFEAGDPGADFNRDGFVDGIDYDQFNIHFEAGC